MSIPYKTSPLCSLQVNSLSVIVKYLMKNGRPAFLPALLPVDPSGDLLDSCLGIFFTNLDLLNPLPCRRRKASM